MNYEDTPYADTQSDEPQAQAFPHGGANDTSITVTSEGTPIAVVSDGHAVEWMDPQFEGNLELSAAVYEFAVAAAEIRNQTQ